MNCFHLWKVPTGPELISVQARTESNLVLPVYIYCITSYIKKKKKKAKTPAGGRLCMCSRHPTSHSVQLYRTVREPVEERRLAFTVKYQSRAHPVADRGSLNTRVPAVCCHQIVQPCSCLERLRCHHGSLHPV